MAVNECDTMKLQEQSERMHTHKETLIWSDVLLLFDVELWHSHGIRNTQMANDETHTRYTMDLSYDTLAFPKFIGLIGIVLNE